MKLKIQLNFLVLASTIVFLVIGLIGYIFGGKNEILLNNFINEGERIEKIINHTRYTQVTFQRQVQEWKNILIRGNDPALFDNYLKEFKSKDKEVQENLVSLKSEMKELNLDTKELDTLISDHKELTFKYLKALESFDKNSQDSTRIVDQLVKGIDRDTSQGLDKLTSYIEKQATIEFENLRTESKEKNQQQNIFLLSSVLIGLFFVITLSKFIINKIYD